jgi:hypothetical protein
MILVYIGAGFIAGFWLRNYWHKRSEKMARIRTENVRRIIENNPDIIQVEIERLEKLRNRALDQSLA